MLKILLCDNESLFASGLKIILEAIPQQKIVGIIPNVDKIEDNCSTYKPDVILMKDFVFAPHDGFEAAVKVKKSFGDIKVIMILSYPRQDLLQRAQASGADSCVWASAETHEFHTCLWETMKGKNYYPSVKA